MGTGVAVLSQTADAVATHITTVTAIIAACYAILRQIAHTITTGGTLAAVGEAVVA